MMMTIEQKDFYPRMNNEYACERALDVDMILRDDTNGLCDDLMD